MPSRQQLESALIGADKAGDVQAATMLANALKAGQYDDVPRETQGTLPDPGGFRDAEGNILAPDAVGQPLPEDNFPGQSIIEPILTVATGTAAPLLAGAAGAADLLNPFTDIDDTANMVESLQEAMTFVPRGSKSLKNLQFLAEKLKPVTKAAETVSDVSGESGFEVGGPLLGAFSKAAPTAILTALGAPNMLKAISTAERVAAAAKNSKISQSLQLLKPESKFKQKTLQRLKETSANPELARDIRSVSDGISSGSIKDTGTALVVLEDQVRKTAGNKAADDIASVAKDIEGGDLSAINRLEDVAKEAAEPSPERSLVKFIEDGAGKLKTDPVAKQAVKQGFDEGTVAAIKGSSSADKTLMKRMLDIMKRGKENARFALSKRPVDIPGESLIKRIKSIRTLNRDAGKRLTDVAKTLRGQVVDSSEAISGFMNSLDEMGVTIDGNLKPKFKGSDVEFNAGAKQAIAGIIKRLSRGKPGVVPDAFELHRMKLLIDDMVTYGKSGEGIKGKTERLLKKLRADIDGTLDNNFPEYNDVNTQYADTIDALNSFQDVAGKKMDLSGGNSDKAVGTLLRRLMSNAQSRVNLIDSVDKIDSINKKYGSLFDEDIQTLMLFADELDDVLGPVARASLAGEVSKGVRKAANADIRGAVAEVASSAVEKARGINQENKFKVMMKLLER